MDAGADIGKEDEHAGLGENDARFFRARTRGS